jgi:hypothetical protein
MKLMAALEVMLNLVLIIYMMSISFDVRLTDDVADDDPVFGGFPSSIRATLALIDRQIWVL